MRRDFQTIHNRQPNDTEISLALNISLEEWQEVKLAFQNSEPLSLDATVNNDEDNYTIAGCEVSLKFPTVKLLDYEERWSELEASSNYLYGGNSPDCY